MFKNKIFLSLFIQFTGIGFSLINRLVFSKYLTESEFGIYNLLILLPSMLSLVFNFGLGHAISLEVSKNQRSWKRIFKYTFLYSLLVGMASFFVAVLFLQNFYNDLDSLLIISASLSTSFFIFNYLVSFYFLGREKTTLYFLLTNLIHILSLALFLVIGSVFSFTVEVALVAYIGSGFIIFLFTNILIYKEMQMFNFKDFNETPESVKKLLKRLFKTGLPMYSAALINFFNYRLDSFIIAKMLPFIYLGNYSLAVLIIDAIGKVSQTFSLFLFSKIPNSNKEQSTKLTVKYSLIVMLINIVAAIMIVLFLKMILDIVFPEKYEFVYKTTMLLLPGMIFIGQFRIYYHYLAANGEGNAGTKATLIGFVFTIILNILLIPKFHIYGAAIASSISYCISLVIIFWMFRKYEKKGKIA